MPIPATPYIWFNGKLVAWEKATVHVLAHALHYGSSVFEGMRAYETPQGRGDFSSARPHPPAVRFGQDLSHPDALQQPSRSTMPAARSSLSTSLRAAPTSARSRFRGYGEIGVAPKIDPPVDVAVAAWEWGKYLGHESEAEGVDVCVSSWQRVAPNTLPALAKAGGNYLSSQLISQEAKRLGFAEGIGLAPDGTVSEGAGENMFLVKDGVLLTPGSGALGARRHHARYGHEAGARCWASRCARPRFRASCCIWPMSCSSPAPRSKSPRSARWIASPWAAGKRGPITERLQQAFFGLFSGATPDRWGWLDTWTCTAQARAKAGARAAGGAADDEDDVPESLGAARGRARDRRYAGGALHRPAPDPRGDLAAGLHGAARARPEAAAPGPHHSRPSIIPARRAPSRSSAARRSRSSRRRGRSRSSRTTAPSSASSCSACKSDQRGIVHIIGPELGLTLPGQTLVCGDSHTSTHGAFGALAFGIGTTEVGHVFATQCLLQRRPKTFAINVEGTARPGRDRQGPDPGDHRRDRRRRRHRPRARVPRRGDPRARRWKSA